MIDRLQIFKNIGAAVIDKERKKQSDAETKIKILKEQIAALG